MKLLRIGKKCFFPFFSPFCLGDIWTTFVFFPSLSNPCASLLDNTIEARKKCKIYKDFFSSLFFWRESSVFALDQGRSSLLPGQKIIVADNSPARKRVLVKKRLFARTTFFLFPPKKKLFFRRRVDDFLSIFSGRKKKNEHWVKLAEGFSSLLNAIVFCARSLGDRSSDRD